MKKISKKNKIIIAITVIVIIIGGVLGVWKYNQYQRVNDCKKVCFYDVDTKTWQFADNPFTRLTRIRSRFTGRSFPTLEQCIDYCLSIR